MSGKRISSLNVKKEFSFAGLVLIIYTLFFLITPQLLLVYLRETNSFVLKNETIFFGVYYIFVLLSMIPFLLLMKSGNIKLSKMTRKINASFKDIFSQTIVFFTFSTLAIYLLNTVSVWFGYSGRLISNIGNILSNEYLHNRLYVFMFLVACPLVEEFIFRGILLSYLKRYGKRFAMFATAIIYALAHTYFTDMIPSFVMGVLLAKSALRYKSIQTPIIIHILFNLLIYILCIVPNNIANFIWLGLLVVYILAIVFVITKNYSFYRVPSSFNAGLVERIFFTRISVIIALILMIIKSLMFMYL